MWIWLAYIVAAALSVPALIVCAECLAALLPRRTRRESTTSDNSRPPVAVLVPAHNEEGGLGTTLKQISSQLREGDRLVVVADNCSDQTAAVARSHGVACVERWHEVHRGKGYALDAGLKHLESHCDPSTIVVMVDADSQVEAGTIDALVQQVIATGRPAQAVYLMEAPDAAQMSPRTAVSMLAVLVKNWVRPLGLERLGMPCVLTGTGMAFAWDDIRNVAVASGNIVEDMQLGLDLAARGKGPLLCESARVSGVLPIGRSARATQRRRWEHGHLRTIFTQAPRLFVSAFTKLDPRLLVLALDVAVPPLSLLVLLMIAAVAAGIALGTTQDVWGPMIIVASALVLLVFCVSIVWARFARGRVPGKALAAAPIYALSKVMVYVGFLFKREKKWIRTERPREVAQPEMIGVKKAG
jgi:cellulose synthase/poly-beta-1,6-N-acetylglucosamine synthase-like glycosyltransferase